MRPQYSKTKTAVTPPLNARDRKAMEASAYDHDTVTAIIQDVMATAGIKMLTRAQQQRVADIYGMVLA